MAMKLEKENVRNIFNNLLNETDLWEREGKEAEKILCYISGLQDMANAVIDAIIDEIDNAPTVDAVEVVHGRWDEIPNKYMSVSTKNGSYSGHATSCSVCHEINPNAFKTNYCPNCGAKMDGDGSAGFKCGRYRKAGKYHE